MAENRKVTPKDRKVSTKIIIGKYKIDTKLMPFPEAIKTAKTTKKLNIMFTNWLTV